MRLTAFLWSPVLPVFKFIQAVKNQQAQLKENPTQLENSWDNSTERMWKLLKWATLTGLRWHFLNTAIYILGCAEYCALLLWIALCSFIHIKEKSTCVTQYDTLGFKSQLYIYVWFFSTIFSSILLICTPRIELDFNYSTWLIEGRKLLKTICTFRPFRLHYG